MCVCARALFVIIYADVLLIGRTNRKDLIDPALLRPGRFEVDLALTLPTLEGRLAILRIHTRRLAERKLIAVDVPTQGLDPLTSPAYACLH